MTIMRTYQCPGTDTHPAHQFSKLHHPSIEADPLGRFCPTCGYDSEAGDMQPAITVPHLAKTIGKATDGVYRAMEEGSQFRADIAQENHGMDAAEASQMKITNMKDNAYQGESSEIPTAQGPGSFQGQAGLGYSAAVSQGAFPNAGARAQRDLRASHAALTGGSATSSLPALETQSPNYRPRVN